MVEFSPTPQGMANKHIAVYVVVVALACAAGGYALHEHSTARNLAADNAQTTAALNSTQQRLSDLAAKVNTLATRETPPAAPATSVQTAGGAPRPTGRRQAVDLRYRKLQSQLDAQGKAIDDTRSELAGTQGDLASARTELTGSIAHTHDELVLLEKKGEREYAEFDLQKAKQFKREGQVELRLKKADAKHQFADMELMVDDRNLSQKHVNLYQPVMFYTPDSPQPIEVVINSIGKDHIHGYVSASKYRQSELASMSSNGTGNGAEGANAGAENSRAANSNSNEPPAGRQKLPMPQQ